MRLQWLLVTLATAVVIAIIHVYALAYDLYWTYRWLDTPMHLLGGFFLGSFAAGIMRQEQTWGIIALIVVAAIAWEVFELMTSMPQPNPYFIDTIHDYVNAGLGAMFAFMLARETVWRSV